MKHRSGEKKKVKDELMCEDEKRERGYCGRCGMSKHVQYKDVNTNNSRAINSTGKRM